MSHAFLQKATPVSDGSFRVDDDIHQPSKSCDDSNRRVRKSAAMIGLAISMGACGTLLPQDYDEAVASESVYGDTVATSASSSGSSAAQADLYAYTSAGTSAASHTVQEGETLFTLADRYSVNPSTIADVNRISADSVLRVGQVLSIPASPAVVAQAVAPSFDAQPVDAPAYYGMMDASSSDSSAVENDTRASGVSNAALKQRQDNAVAKMREKQEALRLSLQASASSTQKIPEELRQPVQVPVVLAPPTELAQLEVPDASSPRSEASVPVSQVLQPAAPKSANVPTSLPTSDSALEFNQKDIVKASTAVNKPQAQAAQSRPTAYEASELSKIARALVPSSSSALPAPEQFRQSGSKQQTPQVITHQVSPGDTLSGIARAHGLTVKQLAQANGISNPDFITVSQVIKVPKVVKQSEVMPAIVQRSVEVAARPTDRTLSVLSTSEQFGSLDKAAIASPLTSESAQPTSIAAPIPAGESSTPSSAAVLPAPPDQSASLRQDIAKLREKYQGRISDVVTKDSPAEPAILAAPEEPPTTSRAVNPEFRAPALVERAQSEGSGRRGAAVQAQSSAQPQAEPQLIAAAPLGSEQYDPIVNKSVLGQVVSPELPPIGSGENFLPSAPNQFNGYIWPTRGVLTSGYGWRWGRMHRGIDIAASTGTPILAAAEGVVITAGWNSGGYGYLVEIKHGDGSVTLYAHNDRVLVRVGQQVQQGQQIAEMGSTGYSTGPHLHFEVHPAGRGAANPMAYLPRS